MKKLILALAASLASSAFAGLNATDTNQKCLDILLKNASNIAVEGQVEKTDTLISILSKNLSPERGLKSVVTNDCVKITYDGIYECHMTLALTTDAGVIKEATYISYEIGVAMDNDTPESMLLPKVYVAVKR